MINKLENYLIGKNGYLKSKLSNGKVIMLSGKWGSGKTHFWQNRIIPKLNDKNIKVANHYISLYGKTSIDEIKNEIFIKIFESVDSNEIEEKSLDITKKSVGLVSSLAKTVSVFGMSLDLSKITDKTFESLENLLEDKKLKKTEEYLNSGAVICFDDFERKSKEIDLNDLFGFITQLSLNFNCKVVIILNDDVFEGEEKRIFSNVKEKSISKFLYYQPTIEELFTLIFESDVKYKILTEYKELILKTIEETEELNARIYMQILDNLREWKEKKQKIDNTVIRCLILSNICFLNNHIIFSFSLYPEPIQDEEYLPTIFFKLEDISVLFITALRESVRQHSNDFNLKLEVIDNVKTMCRLNKGKKLEYELSKDIEKINKYENLIWSFWFFDIKLKYRKNISEVQLEKINTFIETGIL